MESEKYSWQGYLRQDGRCGIRNHILVIYTVKCSEFVARKIVENSDDPDVELIGFDGCTDNQYAVNLLISMIRHPNVGAVLAVGLGCEYIQPEWLADIAWKEGKPSEWLFIQNEGGTLNAVKKGLDWVGKAKNAAAGTTCPYGSTGSGHRGRMRRIGLYQRIGRQCCGGQVI